MGIDKNLRKFLVYLENMETSYLNGVADGCSEAEDIET